MRTNSKFVHALLLLILLSLPVAAHADTVEITGGTIGLGAGGAPRSPLTGQGLVLNAAGGTLNPLVTLFANGRFSAGQVVGTGGLLDTQDGGLSLINPIVVGGVAFSPQSSLLQLSFSSASFTVPGGGHAGFSVIAPFTLTSGALQGYAGQLGGSEPLFDTSLTGGGTTTLIFFRTGAGDYELSSQTFVFGQTVSGVSVNTIPEPATVLMLGTGLVGLAAAGRRKRRRENQ